MGSAELVWWESWMIHTHNETEENVQMIEIELIGVLFECLDTGDCVQQYR